QLAACLLISSLLSVFLYSLFCSPLSFFFFFFNDTATTEIYTLSLHDALPIYFSQPLAIERNCFSAPRASCSMHSPRARGECIEQDRKSTRLNSSHVEISYAVFCLKKKKKKNKKEYRERSKQNE